MGDGWRSRVLAPVYAFGLAFVLSALGLHFAPGTTDAAASDPTPAPVTTSAAPAPTPATRRIQLLQLGSGGEKAPLERGRIEVTPDGRPTQPITLDKVGKGTVAADVDLTVCAPDLRAAQGWTLAPPDRSSDPDRVCLRAEAGTEQITVVVTRQAS